MSFYESFDIGVAKIAFSLERLYYGRIFLTELGGTFLPAFFLVPFFLGEGENCIGKKLGETQSMKIQVKSGETPICKNVGKMKQNVESRRLTPKSAKLTCYPILKIHSRENTRKDLKISKTGTVDKWVLGQVKKYISTVCNVG